MPLLKLSALVIEKRLCPKGLLWPPGRWGGPGDLLPANPSCPSLPTNFCLTYLRGLFYLSQV